MFVYIHVHLKINSFPIPEKIGRCFKKTHLWNFYSLFIEFSEVFKTSYQDNFGGVFSKKGFVCWKGPG